MIISTFVGVGGGGLVRDDGEGHHSGQGREGRTESHHKKKSRA